MLTYVEDPGLEPSHQCLMALWLAAVQAPDSHVLEKFLSRLPLNFNVAILSPHGFFG